MLIYVCIVLNSDKKIILTLVLSEKKILNETKNHSAPPPPPPPPKYPHFNQIDSLEKLKIILNPDKEILPSVCNFIKRSLEAQK
jgi:hypothetical protein